MNWVFFKVKVVKGNSLVISSLIIYEKRLIFGEAGVKNLVMF
jgi:hypothetical protein